MDSLSTSQLTKPLVKLAIINQAIGFPCIALNFDAACLARLVRESGRLMDDGDEVLERESGAEVVCDEGTDGTVPEDVDVHVPTPRESTSTMLEATSVADAKSAIGRVGGGSGDAADSKEPKKDRGAGRFVNFRQVMTKNRCRERVFPVLCGPSSRPPHKPQTRQLPSFTRPPSPSHRTTH